MYHVWCVVMYGMTLCGIMYGIMYSMVVSFMSRDMCHLDMSYFIILILFFFSFITVHLPNQFILECSARLCQTSRSPLNVGITKSGNQQEYLPPSRMPLADYDVTFKDTASRGQFLAKIENAQRLFVAPAPPSPIVDGSPLVQPVSPRPMSVASADGVSPLVGSVDEAISLVGSGSNSNSGSMGSTSSGNSGTIGSSSGNLGISATISSNTAATIPGNTPSSSDTISSTSQLLLDSEIIQPPSLDAKEPRQVDLPRDHIPRAPLLSNIRHVVVAEMVRSGMADATVRRFRSTVTLLFAIHCVPLADNSPPHVVYRTFDDAVHLHRAVIGRVPESVRSRPPEIPAQQRVQSQESMIRAVLDMNAYLQRLFKFNEAVLIGAADEEIRAFIGRDSIVGEAVKRSYATE